MPKILVGAGGIASHGVRITMPGPLNWPRFEGGGIGADHEARGWGLTTAEAPINTC